MRSPGPIMNQHGFTLHEVLVAVVVSSLLIAFGLSVFLFAQKFLLAHQRSSNLKAAVDRTLHVLGMDIERSSRLEEMSDSTLVIRAPEQRRIRYRFDELVTERNGSPMHDEALHIRGVVTELEPRNRPMGRQRVLRIQVFGEDGDLHYHAETLALVSSSARQEFNLSPIRVR